MRRPLCATAADAVCCCRAIPQLLAHWGPRARSASIVQPCPVATKAQKQAGRRVGWAGLAGGRAGLAGGRAGGRAGGHGGWDLSPGWAGLGWLRCGQHRLHCRQGACTQCRHTGTQFASWAKCGALSFPRQTLHLTANATPKFGCGSKHEGDITATRVHPHTLILLTTLLCPNVFVWNCPARKKEY